MAHEALRKICQEKDRQIQHLEEVLDQTIREKVCDECLLMPSVSYTNIFQEHLSAGMINLREEINAKGEQLDRLEANFNEYQVRSLDFRHYFLG